MHAKRHSAANLEFLKRRMIPAPPPRSSPAVDGAQLAIRRRNPQAGSTQ
jgi:hypothetical protein